MAARSVSLEIQPRIFTLRGPHCSDGEHQGQTGITFKLAPEAQALNDGSTGVSGNGTALRPQLATSAIRIDLQAIYQIAPSAGPSTPPPGGPGGGCEGPLAQGQGLRRARRQTTLRARRDHDAVALRCPTEAGIGRAGVEWEGNRVRLGGVEGIDLIFAAADREAGHAGTGADAIAVTAGVEEVGETWEGTAAAPAELLCCCDVQERRGALAHELGQLRAEDLAIRPDRADGLGGRGVAAGGGVVEGRAADFERQQIEAARIVARDQEGVIAPEAGRAA